ncbi:hypothetical protein CDAR_571981, partial [Caerostris darwini]
VLLFHNHHYRCLHIPVRLLSFQVTYATGSSFIKELQTISSVTLNAS